MSRFTEPVAEKLLNLEEALEKHLSDKEISIEFDPAAVALLALEGFYDPAFGARPLKRLIQQKVVNLLIKGSVERRYPLWGGDQAQAKRQ